MKKFSVIPLIAALAVFVSCQKQQTEEERKAEVERQVQDRLAAERVEAEKKRIEEDRAKLDAREKAVADRELAATVTATPVPVEEPTVTTRRPLPTERVETEMPTQSSAAYGMFYEKLDPYGEWRETSNYGYVWQPREAESSRDWRPYTEGRWVYSDAGWTWVSDEPFGWATYHYGRWVRLRRVGWVWVPGDEWAPAWVSWRSNKDYVGWAPLPPEARFDRRSGIQNWADSYYDIGPDQYAFVPCNDFGAEHVRRSVVPVERNVTIVVETTNVTRITFSNTTIVNEGPSYDELRSRSQRPIERYSLRRERNLDVTARISGNELEVSVPVLSDVRNIFRPRRVKERVTEVNIDNGWTSVSDRSAAERARTKIRTEATPPPNAPPKVFVKPTETATASATAATAASPTSTAAAATSSTPAAASPTATVAKVSPTPAATATAATAASSTPAAAATVARSATPAVSASPRMRPSVTPRTRPSPSIAASPAASPSVAASPAAAAVASPSAAAVATPTPAVANTPPVRMRPSPSIPSRPVQTPAPVERRTPPSPPLTTPATRTTPAAESQPTTTAAPTFTPPPRRPNVPPRATPTPNVNADTAQPPMPRDNPKRVMPQRQTPPPATTPAPATTPVVTPNAAPSAPATNNDRDKNRRPRPPVPGATESGTPTPAPSTAPQ